MIRIWLDDLRPCPRVDWVHVKTAEAAISLIETGDVEFISFDHDLGDMKVRFLCLLG